MSRRQLEFEQVAMPHVSALLGFAARLTHRAAAAEDLVQETLFLAWRAFGRFERNTNARAWLFRILINAFNSQKRRAGARDWVALTSEMRSVRPGTDEHVEVTQALDRLNAEQRTVLLLAAVEGFSCREIAEILALPIGTVMSRLSRAREAMRIQLGPYPQAQKVAQ